MCEMDACCVRFKSEIVACGVVYAAARRFQVPLPENPPWWKAFDADKSEIDEVCRVLAHLYSLTKAQYIPVCKEGGSFATSSRSRDSPNQSVSKDGSLVGTTTKEGAGTVKVSSTSISQEVGKDETVKAALDKLKESKKSDDESKGIPVEEESREEPESKLMPDHRTETGGERNKKRERGRDRERARERERERERRELKAETTIEGGNLIGNVDEKTLKETEIK